MVQIPKLKKDWKGLRVKSLRPLENGRANLPAGAMFTVIRNYGGLRLKSDPCPHCSIRFFVNKVPESSVEIIEEES